MINASFVFGLDGDTPDTFRHTLDWIVRNKIETVTSHILTPYPGTKQHQDMMNAGRITDFDLRNYTTSEVVYNPIGLSPEQLKKGYENIYKEIYSWKNIFRRLPKYQKTAYLLFNIFYRKYGKMTEKICRALSYRQIGTICENFAIRTKPRQSR